MSRLVKSSQITIDKKKYFLSNDFFIPEDKEEQISGSLESHETVKMNLKDELHIMKENMLEEIKIESDNKLASAKEEFESILKNAYDQSSEIRKISEEEGLNKGYEEGLNKGYAKADALIEEALEIKEKYKIKFENIKKEAESELTDIIVLLTETILNKHIDEDEDLIKGLVEKALLKCAYTANLILRVAPEDYDGAVSYKRYILSLTEGVDDIEIKQDIALIPGSCVIDTDAGSVDSSVHTQFDNIKNHFLEVLKNNE